MFSFLCFRGILSFSLFAIHSIILFSFISFFPSFQQLKRPAPVEVEKTASEIEQEKAAKDRITISQKPSIDAVKQCEKGVDCEEDTEHEEKSIGLRYTRIKGELYDTVFIRELLFKVWSFIGRSSFAKFS